ncbi:uncharacterized protein K452DRAFT_354259 [Aplosporella prunicola CBS 121167]|uniref:non-specific serine/threonine protein kinase n=1 Tax=Aplosporella prunicola CBS 121167 TaxID=1176127 RepID=A0A6A6AX34_9PEZI|nr:uncharacterized protein K452DRAFT_354259 [Aplosporella prunicola CBS 121167]KAF2135733.1 hypothetical protein K452DRAFT_354259 [Aplosporella prunicola CBS 121167]
MDRSSKQARQPSKQRKALADAGSRANAAAAPQQRLKQKAMQPTTNLPHNESIVTNGPTLTVRNPGPADNKRLSVIQDEDNRSSNRNSAISTASSTMSAGGRRKTHIGPWQLGRTIGEGGCSRVRMVRHSLTGQLGAAKIISKKMADKVKAQSLLNLYKSAETDPELLAQMKIMPFGLEREIVIMKLLEHQNIVKLYDVWENRSELYLIMEYIDGGELFDYIDVDGGLDELEVVFIFRQIIAALLYCHRIHIHHRDLKPENILVDKESWEIKLVDFGMAALQPEGRFLSTPCGSPHYAAPEVIRYKRYDGGQADVWSCGVILYVMLTGGPPFTYSGHDADLAQLFKLIAKAQYVMPDHLSPEAKDLISQILVPDPRKRITIEKVWNHPFLHKYDEELEMKGEKAKIETWIGARPRIENWDVSCLDDIDREIVRNMRTLWHSEPEEVLLQKLLSPEPNQEKYFYSALAKHRDEHLETWGGTLDVGYSASDYHHVHHRRREVVPPVPTGAHGRTKSQFSILNDEHLRSRHSLQEPTPSEQSYDPFRASREPSLANKENPYMNVTVHRGGSIGSGGRRRSTVTSNHHGQASMLRVEALKKTNWRSSGLSSNGSRSSRKGSPAGTHRRNLSKASSTSSVWPSSPPVIVRPASSHKRGVSFAHLRRSSTLSRLTDSVQYTPEQNKFLQNSDVLFSATPSSVAPSAAAPLQSSTPIVEQPLRSRKESKGAPIPRLKVRKSETPSRLIEGDVRKASTELEKVLDEAFNNRSSVNSSLRTSTTAPPTNYETPPSSVSHRGSGASAYAAEAKAFDTNITQRPLPPLPTTDDSPNSHITRELAVTRDRLAARLALEDRENADKYDAVLAHLDSLLNSANSATQADGTRSTSAPHPKSPEHLPIISEEGKTPADTPNWRSGYSGDKNDTIRMVDPSSPCPPGHIAPLKIRKASTASTVASPARTVVGAQSQLQVPKSEVQPLRRKSSRLSDRLSSHEVSGASTPNKDASKDAKDAKKKSWFRRKFSDSETPTLSDTPDVKQQIPEAWKGLDDRMDPKPKARPALTRVDTDGSSGRCGPDKGSKKGGLWKWLGKKDAKKGMLELASPTELSNSSFLSSNFDLPEGSPDSSRAIEGQNWLARFLHIKPATKALCFQVGRGRARSEIVRLLRDWKRFGVRDVSYDRVNNVITARVDKENHLKIKPVAFIAELYVVLEHGRRAQLCLVRFTQTRGAASSFRKVVDVLDDCFSTRGMLVENEDRKRAMVDMLG